MADAETDPDAGTPTAEAEIEQDDLDEGDGADTDAAARQPASPERRASASLKRARRAMQEAELVGEHRMRFFLEEANTLALLAIASALREGRQD